MKRVLAILLVIAIAFVTVCPVAASDDNAFTVSLGSGTVNVDGSLVVPLTFENVPEDGIYAMNIQVVYDSSVLKLDEISTMNGTEMSAIAMLLMSGGAVATPNAVSGIIPASFPNGCTENGTYWWLKFTPKAEAINGDYELSLTGSWDNSSDSQLPMIVTDGNILMDYSQKPGTITVTGGAEPVATTVEVTSETGAVAVPTKAEVEAGSKAIVQMSAVVKNQIGGVMEGQSVAWDLQDNPEGVSISDSGLVTVDNTAAAGEITVAAQCGEASGTAVLTLTRETAQAAEVVADDRTVEVPALTEREKTVELTAAVYDQYGVPMSGQPVAWRLVEAPAGVSLYGSTLTVTNEAQAGAVQIKAACGGYADTATITIRKAAAVPETVVIQRGGKTVVSDSITILQSGSSAVTYTAVVYDQYGAKMENPAVTWTLTGTGKGVSQEAGAVTVAPDAAAGTYTLEADCGGKTAQAAISVTKITFRVVPEISTMPVYGETWEQIVSRVSGTAAIDGTKIDGTFSVLHADAVPDAGVQSYGIVFQGAGYENVAVCTGLVPILPKSVSITGITARDKTYDGSANADFNVSDAQINGIVRGDSLIVASAAGTFADGNVGTGKEVHISKIRLGGADAANYIVDSGSQKVAVASITAREITVSGITAQDKEYDGKTAAQLDCNEVTFVGKVYGDDLTVTSAAGTFADKNAGDAKSVTVTEILLGGEDAGNYTVSQPADVTATISRKPVTITGAAADNKVYDGTTAATVAQAGEVTDKLKGDDVTVQAGAAQFASADAGEDIRVTFSGFTLTGANAGNYVLSAQPADGMADIAKAVYPGRPVVNIDVMTQQAEARTGSLTASDFFATAPSGAEIKAVASKTVSNHIMDSVTASGGEITYTSGVNLPTANLTDTYEVTISTKNYSDIQATLTFTTVDKTPVTVSGVAVADKTYDGKALTYTGTPAAKTADGETVAVSGFTYTWKDSEGQLLTSAPKNAGIYTLTVAVEDSRYTGAVTLNCTIAKAAVTITALDVSAPVGSKLPTFSYRVAGLAEGESLKTEPTLTCAADMNKTGVYAIKASGAEVPEGGNYNDAITYVDGKLTVYYHNTANRVTVYGGAHGIARVDDYNPAAGDRVTITVTPDEGYEVDQVLVTTASGKKVPVTRTGENRYVFEMPSGSVSIQVTYKAEEKVVYTDVSPYAWYAEAVEYVTVQGLMNGVGEGKFAPSAAVTRAMVWTVLARMDGENTEGGSAWYSKARTWAMENGVSDGAAPEAAITREQLATMLYRYCGSPAVSGSLSGYADGSSVSDWAEDAMLWAIEQGLIEGVGDNKLAPAADTTRAQLAQILMRFDKKF